MIKTIRLLYKNIFGNIILCLGIVVGFLYLYFKRYLFEKKYAKEILLFCLLTTGIFIYIGGTNYHYYSLPLSPFILIGLIILFSYIKIQKRKWMCVLCLGICTLASFKISTNPRMMQKEKKDYAQFIFAEEMKETPNASILNYGFLDGGFYLATQTEPKFYYFMKNNISYKNYPEMMDEQDRYVREAAMDYIVVKSSISTIKKQIIEMNYHEVKRHTQKNNLNQKITYILYKKDIQR